MFCSKCGTSVNKKLNYCNYCGAKIVKADEEKDNTLIGLVVAVSLTGVLGLGILIGLIGLLLAFSKPSEVIVMISLAYLATLFGICFMMIRSISKLIDVKLENKKSEKSESAQPPLLSSPQTAQLKEYYQPAMSVTEDTTRNFEKIPIKES